MTQPPGKVTTKHVISIEIDESMLRSYTDTHLAMLWHVAQANPAKYGDKHAGELVERIGREIIRRWLRDVPPELHHHQGRAYYWKWLTEFAKYVPGEADFHDGIWVPRDTDDDAEGDAEGPAAAAGNGRAS